MAGDAVTKTTLVDDGYRYGIHLTNISDGTGETNVIKADKSAIGVASDGAEAASLDLAQARWSIQGMTYVKLSWDHNTDDVAFIMAAGSGYEDFVRPGGGFGGGGKISDPRSTGGTGDVLLTTIGAVSGGTYDITLWFQKAAD